MDERIQEELDLVRERHGELAVGPNADWMLFDSWALPAAWSKQASRLLVLIPAGYPTTPPDNFYMDNDLRLADGRMPQNSTPNHQQAGQPWLQFSYHVDGGGWKPHAQAREGHNLLTFLEAVQARLTEAV